MISLTYLLLGYTPLPWIFVLCLILYRHGPSQLFHPLKDGCSVVMWKRVLLELGIPFNAENSIKSKKTIPKFLARLCQLFSHASERYPNARFHLFVLTVVLGCSLLSSFVIEPLFSMGDSHSSRVFFLVPFGLQIFSALPSILSIRRHFGPFPTGPYKMHLRKRRLGSLMRYARSIF
jgi:hypothetical protein